MDQKALQEIQRMMAAMKNRPEDEVVEEFAALINSGKAGMNKQQAINLIGMMKPMLNAQQRRTVDKLVQKLK